MIKKVNKIKKLGLVFSNYAWNSRLSDYQLSNFNRYNLIYGWTGTGKTTLSKLFGSIQDEIAVRPSDLSFEFEDDQSTKYTQADDYPVNLRVFNERFVEENLQIREGKAKVITIVLGDANKETVEQIESDSKELARKEKETKEKSTALERLKKTRGKSFTEIAKTIYVAIVGGAIRNYRKDNAENDFLSLKKKELLPDAELDKYAIVVKQVAMPEIDELGMPSVTLESGEDKELDTLLDDEVKKSRELMSKTVESQVIERLKDNPDIASWVEQGLDIHTVHDSKSCEFCGQTIPKHRLPELLKHFNEADKALKSELDNVISQLANARTALRGVVLPDKARFYDESQGDYEKDRIAADTQANELSDAILLLIEELKQKKSKTTEQITLNTAISTSAFLNAHKVIGTYIEKNNKKTQDFEKAKTEVIGKLKRHYLSTIYDEIAELDKKIKSKEEEIKTLRDGTQDVPDDLGIVGLKKRIASNQAKISSTHKACEDINASLARFLDRDELIFEPHKTKVVDENGSEKEIEDGYIIKRNGTLAHNLSAGEKTAIAFVYFIIHLTDQDFDLKNGIVVIDDPISSLDSNSLFQAFAFLKTAVKDAKQVFIFTHNYEFLKLLLNWVKNSDHGRRSSYYMIKNYYDNGRRCAYLDKMDKELYEYESEYHYLFKILSEFQSDGTIARAYPIPNIARKVLDTFLLFRVPTGGGTYKKLEKLGETTGFDETKLTAIFKFTNDQSHITGSGFDPSLVPETQKNVKYLLEMIKEVFPEHYKILQESIQ